MTLNPRRFYLQRDEDETGTSGTGRVADGVQFVDGTCVLRWLTAHTSTAIYSNPAEVELIHGHGGKTRIVWIDSASESDRLARIAEGHSKHVTAGGMTSGDCDECGWSWPCPTYIWATTERDYQSVWNPADDELVAAMDAEDEAAGR